MGPVTPRVSEKPAQWRRKSVKYFSAGCITKGPEQVRIFTGLVTNDCGSLSGDRLCSPSRAHFAARRLIDRRFSGANPTVDSIRGFPTGGRQR